MVTVMTNGTDRSPAMPSVATGEPEIVYEDAEQRIKRTLLEDGYSYTIEVTQGELQSGASVFVMMRSSPTA
jgi:hypothetical protein